MTYGLNAFRQCAFALSAALLELGWPAVSVRHHGARHGARMQRWCEVSSLAGHSGTRREGMQVRRCVQAGHAGQCQCVRSHTLGCMCSAMSTQNGQTCGLGPHPIGNVCNERLAHAGGGRLHNHRHDRPRAGAAARWPGRRKPLHAGAHVCIICASVAAGSGPLGGALLLFRETSERQVVL